MTVINANKAMSINFKDKVRTSSVNALAVDTIDCVAASAVYRPG